MPREAGLPNQKVTGPLYAEVDSASENNARAACEGRPDLMSDYESPFEDHSEAKKLCDTCDVYGLCKRQAKALKPAWGIWHGEIYYNGKRRNLAARYNPNDHANDSRECDDNGYRLVQSS